jgi:hypothetical protein
MVAGKIQQEFYIRSNKAASHISLDGAVLVSAIVSEGGADFRLFEQASPLKIPSPVYLPHKTVFFID